MGVIDLFSKKIEKIRDRNYFSESYSLEGEDMIIKRFFQEKPNGYYVDIGANAPFRFSNTYYLYKKGWKGINVDADKGCVRDLKKYRNRDISIHAFVGNSSAKRRFYKFHESALNTFTKRLAEEYAKLGYKLKGVSKATTATLSSILDKYLESDLNIDFLNIDVEGDELAVLQSNNWEKYRPHLIIVESLNEKNIKTALNNEITKFMKKCGYDFYMKTINNCYYTDMHR